MESVETLFERHYEPLLKQAQGMRSLFDHNDEQLRRRMGELGTFFGSDYASDDMALQVIYRSDEIHQKATNYPIETVISRQLPGLMVKWSPLWCKKGAAYAQENLKTEFEIERDGESLDDYWLTSRGVAEADLDQIWNHMDWADFTTLIRRSVKPVLPTHSVYDGERLYLYYVMYEVPDTATAGPRTFERIMLTDEAQEYAGYMRAFSRVHAPAEPRLAPTEAFARFDRVSIDSIGCDRIADSYDELNLTRPITEWTPAGDSELTHTRLWLKTSKAGAGGFAPAATVSGRLYVYRVIADVDAGQLELWSGSTLVATVQPGTHYATGLFVAEVGELQLKGSAGTTASVYEVKAYDPAALPWPVGRGLDLSVALPGEGETTIPGILEVGAVYHITAAGSGALTLHSGDSAVDMALSASPSSCYLQPRVQDLVLTVPAGHAVTQLEIKPVVYPSSADPAPTI